MIGFYKPQRLNTSEINNDNLFISLVIYVLRIVWIFPLVVVRIVFLHFLANNEYILNRFFHRLQMLHIVEFY